MKYGVTNYINHKSDLLTDLQVHEVCRYLLEGFTMKEVAEKVGCNEQQVKDIRYAGNYSHISSFYRLEDIPERKRWNRIEDNKVVKICKMIESKKYSCAEIARILNVSKSTVLGIKNNELYVDISKDYIMPGKSNRLNSFNEEDAERVCKELIKKDNRTIKELARDTDTTEYFVSDIKRCRIKRFKEITDKYNIKNNK